MKQTDYGCFLFRSNSENSPTLFLSYSSYLERENQTNGRKEIYHVMIHKHIKQYIIGISTTRVLLIDIDDTHIFHLVFNCFNNYLHAFVSWHVVIWLEDGSWVTLKCVYNSYEDDYIFKIERHKPPMISKVDFGRIPVEYTITTLNI